MKKGQLLSLDLLIALIIIILGIGLMIQWTETRIYSQKEELMQKELESIGKTASMLLASSPEIACELRSIPPAPKTITFLENCIDTSGNYAAIGANKNILGIPDGYDFGIFDSTGNLLKGKNIPSPNPKNIFSEKRTVALNNGKISKAELEACMSGGACTLSQQEITIKIWRS